MCHWFVVSLYDSESADDNNIIFLMSVALVACSLVVEPTASQTFLIHNGSSLTSAFFAQCLIWI